MDVILGFVEAPKFIYGAIITNYELLITYYLLLITYYLLLITYYLLLIQLRSLNSRYSLTFSSEIP